MQAGPCTVGIRAQHGRWFSAFWEGWGVSWPRGSAETLCSCVSPRLLGEAQRTHAAHALLFMF